MRNPLDDINRGASRLDALAAEAMLAGNDPDAWPEPQPLTVKIDPEPYHVEALPAAIRAAVEEVHAFVKAPLPMVASCALSALSLAGQSHVDVKRAEKLTGPSGLFFLTIADSGERKTTCDSFFTKAIHEFELQQAERFKPELTKYEAALAAWKAEREGVLAGIKQAGKTGKSADKLRDDLTQLEHEKPEPPRVPKLIRGDETPENLAWAMAKEWPSAGVVSSEAGLVFGAHGMGKDSIVRNLGLLNILWDGGAHSVGRRTSESFTIRGARLTVALQIQEMTLRSFFDQSGGLARGTGFLARFLIAWPASTQGLRLFTDPPEHWPHLAAFNRRIAEILNKPAPIGDSGALKPRMLSMTPEAKALWVAFHDALEGELKTGGELYDVRDVASKTADNAARLAALLHLFANDESDAIGADCFDSARCIVAWHLSESRRFFGELALPAELANAARLDAWLLDYFRRERSRIISKSYVMQHGPGVLRDKNTLNAAIAELDELSRLRLFKDGKRAMIEVNPALTGGL